MTLLNTAVIGSQDEQAARDLLRQAGVIALQKQAGYVAGRSEISPLPTEADYLNFPNNPVLRRFGWMSWVTGETLDIGADEMREMAKLLGG